MLPEERLRAHAEAIVRAGRVPGARREGLVEELLSHLLEQFRWYVGAGLDEDAAAERAIREFGEPDALGRDLRDAFRGRFWASTIGTLIPVERSRGGRPGGIGWLAGLTTVGAIFAAVAAGVTAVSSPPVHAIVGLVAYGGAALAMWFGAEALRNGQEWGRGVCVLTALGMLVQGIDETVKAPGLHIAVLGWIAAGVLVWMASNGPVVQAWLRDSRPIPQRWGVAITGAVLAAWVTGPVLAAIPDPTAVGPGDMQATATLTCTELADGQHEPGFRATLRVQARRTSVLPTGLASLGDPVDGAAAIWPHMDGYVPGLPSLVDEASGRPYPEEVVWWQGPWTWPEEPGSVASVPAAALASGGTTVVTWEGTYDPSSGTGSSHAEVRFSYGDTVELTGWLACGETTTLVERGGAR